MSNFNKATEGTDFIDTAKVTILEQVLTVRIKKGYPGVATADSRGEEL